MSNLAEKVFTQLPAYVSGLTVLIGRPKRTIAVSNTGDPGDLRRAIVFAGITVGLVTQLRSRTNVTAGVSAGNST